MRTIILITLFLLSIIGCRQLEQEKDVLNESNIYVIKHNYEKLQDDSIDFIIREFYFDYNIILIDSLPEIFYHKKHFYCLYGAELNNAEPYYRNLKVECFQSVLRPDDLILLLQNDSIRPRSIYLISNKDSIRDNRYFEIKKQLLENDIRVSTRLLTEEENLIMTSIINDEEYKPEESVWKNTLYLPEDFKVNKETVDED